MFPFSNVVYVPDHLVFFLWCLLCEPCLFIIIFNIIIFSILDLSPPCLLNSPWLIFSSCRFTFHRSCMRTRQPTRAPAQMHTRSLINTDTHAYIHDQWHTTIRGRQVALYGGHHSVCGPVVRQQRRRRAADRGPATCCRLLAAPGARLLVVRWCGVPMLWLWAVECGCGLWNVAVGCGCAQLLAAQGVRFLVARRCTDLWYAAAVLST
jgi:hypothetical protein